MQCIKIVGTTGSGKSTLAAAVSQRLGMPHIQLDYLNWEPGWMTAEPEVYEQRVRDAITQASWVMDGNFSTSYDFVWERVDTVIWLDYALPIIVWRQLCRAKRRIVYREECCNGNYESVQQFFSRNSILLWALRTYRKHRGQYQTLFAQPEFAHMTILHFRSPKETARWLKSLHNTDLMERIGNRSV